MTTRASANRKYSGLLLLVLGFVFSLTMVACTSSSENAGIEGDDALAIAEAADDAESDFENFAETDAGADVGDLAGDELGDGPPADDVSDLAADELSFSDEEAPTPQEAAINDELSLDDSLDAAVAATDPTPAPMVEDPSAQAAIESEPIPQDAQTPIAESPSALGAPGGAEVLVTDIRYLSRQAGGTVVIETSIPATFNTREVPAQNQLVVEIANAQIPERLKRPYVTKDFNQAITSINAYQDPGSTTVRVVVQFKDAIQADVQQSGSLLSVAAGSPTGNVASTQAENAPTYTQTDEDPIPPIPMASSPYAEASSDARDTRILPHSSVDPNFADSLRFYGRPISIEGRDTPVRDVINLIAEQSGANIVVSGEVDGNISLKLRKIPWDQALLIVMQTRNLGYIRQGSILRIAPFEALQAEADSAKKVYDAQKANEPLRVKIIPVGYGKVTDLTQQVTALLTPSRGRVVAEPRTNSLIVTDTPEILERVASLIRALDTPPLQVLIEGKVVEARDVFLKEAGFNWGASGQSTDLGGNTTILPNLNVQAPRTRAPNLAAGLSVGTFDILGNLNLALELAETEDKIKIVSSPRIVAINNEQATIVQGTNIPIATTTAVGGAVTSSISYRAIETRLEITPQVTSTGDVMMQLNLKREFAGNRQSDSPDINNREAKTKILVRNGQTAVVGGVYQSDISESHSGVPVLKDIPVFGWLFKRRIQNMDKSELLVFLTPRILNAEKSIPRESNL